MRIWPLVWCRYFCFGLLMGASVGFAVDMEDGILEIYLGIFALIIGDWT